MSPNYAAQRDALNELSLAYHAARDFTLPVLRWAFGDPPPPPSKCVWPPPGISEWQADCRLRRVQQFLQECAGLIRSEVRKIEPSQRGVAASGFNIPESWIIVRPLEAFMGGMAGACSVTEIVKSAPAEDAALEKVLRKIAAALVKLHGKIAGSTPPAAKPGQDERNRGAGSTATKARSTEPADKTQKRGRPVEFDPIKDKRVYEAWRTHRYKTYTDCGQALGKSERETYLAVERHRGRLKRKTRKRK